MEFLSKIGELLINLGGKLTQLGVILTPFSFLSYIVMSWLIYKWDQLPYQKLVKIVWYLAAAIYEITNDENFYIVIVLLIFMDIVDSIFEFLEEKRDRKIK